MQEETSDLNSFGFKTFRSPGGGGAAKAVTLAFWTRKGFGIPKYAIEFDIKKCFDTISHEYILDNVAQRSLDGRVLRIIPDRIMMQWLKCGYVLSDATADAVNPTTGVLQGGLISPCISNLVLNGLQEHVTSAVKAAAKKPTYRNPYMKTGSEIGSRYVFLYKGRPLFCSLPSATRPEIDRTILTIAPPVKKDGNPLLRYPRFALSLTLYNRKSLHGWTVKGIDSPSASNAGTLRRQEIYKGWSFLARFADDFLVLCNTEEAAEKAFEAAQDFLTPRGLELSKEKSLIRTLPRERFTFVGFRFIAEVRHGKQKIYNIAPPEKMTLVLKKINNTFKQSCTPLPAFIKVNAIVRGWCNFYSTGNTKDQLQKLSWLLWHLIYRLFYWKYAKQPRFQRDSNYLYTKKLSAFIWHNHLRPYTSPTGRRASKWWYVSKKDRTDRLRGKEDLFLAFPAGYKIATPGMITQRVGGGTLNAYHPEDRVILSDKALSWRPVAKGAVFSRQKAQCAFCGWNLVSEETKFEFHHVRPIKLGGPGSIDNLRVLCKQCHWAGAITSAVRSEDKDAIWQFEQMGLLKGVSESLIEYQFSGNNPYRRFHTSDS